MWVETLAVAIMGGLVWGVAWDLGFPAPGCRGDRDLVTVSPVIESRQ